MSGSAIVRVGVPAGLVLAVLLAYAGALHAPFQFDDWWAIVGDARAHSPEAWWRAQPGIRPLLKLVNALNWTLAATPPAFRAVNIAIHAATALLAWALWRDWLPRLAPRCPRPVFAAALAAALFALHPACTEAVTYLSGRSVSLSTLAMFAALLAWTQAVRDPSRARVAVVAGAVAFVVAVAVRETALVAPLAWLLLARGGGLGWREAFAPLRPLAWLLPLAALGAMLTPGYHSFVGWSLQTRGMGAQLLGQVEAHRYLLLGPLPGRVLDIDPDVRVPVAFAASHGVALAIAVSAGVVAWRQRVARPWLGVALGWYVLQLAPANSLLPRFDLANDRHLYAALAGPALAVAIVVASLRPRAVAVGAATLLLAAAAARTVGRNADYRSELALWEATVATSPAKARPWTNLGFARREAGDEAGARHAFACARALDPGYAPAAWNLAALGPDGPRRAAPACPASL